MNIAKRVKEYVLEEDLKITILNNKINIVNYFDIGHFDNNKIIVKAKEKEIVIYGKLVVSKLLSDEILITGEFDKIEFR